MQVALPPRVRLTLYLVIAVLGVLLSSVQAAFLALGAQPTWLIAAWAAFGPLASAFGLTASNNVHLGPRQPEVPPWQE